MPKPLPMLGECRVIVHGARPFAIHGDSYIELSAEPANDPLTRWTLRVPIHALKAQPAEGQSVTVTFLMGQVTEVRPA